MEEQKKSLWMALVGIYECKIVEAGQVSLVLQKEKNGKKSNT